MVSCECWVLHEAGDLVKRWNLRYFMLFVGSQPTLVYYRKVSGEPYLLCPNKDTAH